MNEKDDLIHISSFLTDVTQVDGNINIDWDPPLYDISIDPEVDHRWVTAIQRVSPKSGAFWYDYGHRYNEKVMLKITTEKDPLGRRCCDVLVYTRRTLGDVVLSAWQEYNKQLVSVPNK